jgi:ParB-like chromosome segregation protein Spo0J
VGRSAHTEKEKDVEADSRTEAWLREHGAKFVPQTIPINDINKEKSHRNQARVTQVLNDDVVLTYATAMAAGKIFPPIVVYRNGGGKYILIDGIHRLAAAELADIAVLPAYVVDDPQPLQIHVLTFEANASHGLPTSMTERALQACFLVESGVSRVDAAKMLNIPESKVALALDTRRSKARVRQVAGAEAAKKLGTQHARRLDDIRSDRVLAAATQFVATAGLGAQDVNQLVSAINREREEDEQMRVIQLETARRAARVAASAGGKVHLPDSLKTLEAALAAVDRIDPRSVSRDWKIVGDGMKMVLLSKTMDAQRKLREVLS